MSSEEKEVLTTARVSLDQIGSYCMLANHGDHSVDAVMVAVLLELDNNFSFR